MPLKIPPELSSYLQVNVDPDQRPGRFVLTGSQQFQVMTAITQSLAGRTALFPLLPFSLEELDDGDRPIDKRLFPGFYPRSHNAQLNPTACLGDDVETYISRFLSELS